MGDLFQNFPVAAALFMDYAFYRIAQIGYLSVPWLFMAPSARGAGADQGARGAQSSEGDRGPR